MSPRFVSFVVLVVLLALTAVFAPLVRADSGANTAVSPIAASAQNQPDTQDAPQIGLPGELGRIFAVLGIFIVTMFTMAIGTEIVVDVFKLILGLESKPTARKTLEEYEKVLPGTLSSLGVGMDAQQRLQYQLADLKRLLEPVFRIEDAVVDLHTDSLKQTVDQLFGSEATAVQIHQATTTLKGRLQHTMTRLAANLRLSNTAVQPLMLLLDKQIDTAVVNLGQLTPDDLTRQLNRLINDNLADPLTNWTRAQIVSMQQKTYAQARLEYEMLLPTLESSGLSPRAIQQVKIQLESFLEQMQRAELGYAYLYAINDLLGNLEKQRNAIRSHIRRFWEWLQKRLMPGRYQALMSERAQRETAPAIQNLEHAAGQLLALDQRDVSDRASYVQLIRLISVIVGVTLAYMLQIDAADLLTDFLPESADFLSTRFTLLPNWPAISAGIILTGLGASAGSGFWHDQLSRLQTVKKGAEAAYTAVQPVIVNQKLTEN
ncbi:MAG: hypothetical protein IPM39_02180 [Chloroflexi bacterium]|nr:hypothetical protein [Chloroflexota bacterium]